MDITPFDRFFHELVSLYISKLDWTWTDFAKVQRVWCDILIAHNTIPSLISTAEYELLDHMALYLYDDMRIVLNGGKIDD